MKYGLGSGIAIGFVDLKRHPVMVALNSREASISPERKGAIQTVWATSPYLANSFINILWPALLSEAFAHDLKEPL